MKIYFASDHAGFELKKTLVAFVRDELKYEAEDCGPFEFDADDDYPVFVSGAVRKLADALQAGEDAFAIVLGASGQGEAMVANRFKGIRAAVFYGPRGFQTDAIHRTMTMLEATRIHNNANVLSLGARFLTPDEACQAVRTWLATPFPGENRHVRRIKEIDSLV